MFFVDALSDRFILTCYRFPLHPWKELKIFPDFSDSGEKLTNEDTFSFFKAANQNNLKHLCKDTFCFLVSLSRSDHIDQSQKLQTEEKMNECSVFSTVFCDFTLMISCFFFFLFVIVIFVMAADRLLIIICL